jgi:hypothetical protein
MAADPIFAATVNSAAGLAPATADTSLTAPSGAGHITTVFTAGSSGSKVEQIRLMQVATTASTTIVNVFLYDGSTYWLFDQFTTVATTLSTTSEPAPVDKFYANLVLKTGWSVRITVTTSAAQAAFVCSIFGADF